MMLVQPNPPLMPSGFAWNLQGRGQHMLSDKPCPHCGSNVRYRWSNTCAQCALMRHKSEAPSVLDRKIIISRLKGTIRRNELTYLDQLTKAEPRQYYMLGRGLIWWVRHEVAEGRGPELAIELGIREREAPEEVTREQCPCCHGTGWVLVSHSA